MKQNNKQSYSIDELKNFPYKSTTLHGMDEEDGSTNMIHEWQKGAFKKLPSPANYEPVEYMGGDVRERITMTIPRFHLLRLKEQANQKGMPYQTFLNSLIKEYLDGELMRKR